MGVDEDGDKALVFGDAMRLKPVLIWKREPNGKIRKELQALKKQNACRKIEQTVTTKGKNNEAAMIFIVRETLMVKVKKECMQLMVRRIICMFRFAVCFGRLTFACPFLLDHETLPVWTVFFLERDYSLDTGEGGIMHPWAGAARALWLFNKG